MILFIYTVFLSGVTMEFLEVAEGLERIQLLAKITHMEDITMREQQIALRVIGEWAREIHETIKSEMKKPHGGGFLHGTGFQ